MVILVALLLGASAADAFAAEATALEKAGIVLTGQTPWPPELVADLSAGLEALPPALRRFPGGTLEFELHPQPSALGMGDGSSERPEWTDGLRRFHLYTWADDDDERASYRLAKLPLDRQISLWRRRAVVHAVMRRWDEQQRFSSHDEWRQLVGWLDAFDRPFTFSHRALVTYPWAFSRRRGMTSAALDLATFAEEALVPVESLEADALAADDRVRCQEFSRSRVLSAFLREAGADVGERLSPDGCDAFERWAQPASFSHFEVLFAAPSGVRPQSLFGHVSLRLVRKPGAFVTGPGTATIVELAALTGPAETGGKYIAKGLTGGFQAVFSTTSLAELLKQNLEVEQRSIRRFHLALSHTEALRALQRIWELERRGYVDYYFFSENCARMLIFLLEPVLEGGGKIDSPGQFVVLPASALDALSSVTVTRIGSDGQRVARPLMSAVSPDFVSSRDEALEAERLRTDTLDAIVSRTSRAADWRRLHAKLRSSDAKTRDAAYREAMGPLVEHTLESEPSLLSSVHAYVTASRRIERYALDRLDARQAAIDVARLRLPEGTEVPTTEAMLEARQRSFQREDAAARLAGELDRVERLNALLASAPRREPTEDEAVLLDALAVQRRVFMAALEHEGRLVDLAGPTPRGPSALQPTTPPANAQRSWHEASGASRLSVSMGAATTGWTTPAPAVTLRTALFAEELGQRRQRGIGASSELRLLDVRSTWALGLDWPKHLRTDFTPVGFRTIQRPPPTLRASVMDWLGWGWAIDVRQRSDREQPLRAVASAELIAPLFTSASQQSQTLFAVGVAPEVRAVWLPKAVAMGAQVRLTQRTHLGGAHANALSLDLTWQPRWTLLGGPVELWHAMTAQVTATRLVAGRVVLGLQALASVDLEQGQWFPYAQAGLVAEW